MNEDLLRIEALGPTARLTLNRPKAMNALSLATLAALETALAEIGRNDEIRVLVLTGTGAAFCAGADLKEVLAGAQLAPGEADFQDRANVVYGQLRNFPKPVIAALNGVTRDFLVEKLAREAIVVPIPEGTTQIQQLLIGRALTGVNAF